MFSYLGKTILLVQLGDENELPDLTDECDRFCKYANRIIGADVTIGIGKVCSTILELSESYAGAREAVSYRVIYGAIRAINIMEIAPQEMKESGITGDEELAHLFKVIRLNEKEDIIQAVNRYCSHISVVENHCSTIIWM